MKTQKMMVWILGLVLAGLALPAPGAFRLVPYGYLTIQEAIDASGPGDIVIVAPGTYVENLVFRGVDITVTSVDPLDPATVEATIIDGNFNGCCVTFNAGETNACVLEGFLIRHGKNSTHPNIGGGIFMDNSSPTIRYCVITRNGYSDASYDTPWQLRGGGIALWYDCRPVIEHCLIVKNGVDGDGGGIYCNKSGNTNFPIISHCTITDNETTDLSFFTGTQIHAYLCEITIDHCIIYQGDGTDVTLGDPSLMTYSCVATAYNSYEMYDPSTAGGNIVAYPGFDYWKSMCAGDCVYGEYLLRANSACIDAGDPGLTADGIVDFEGQPRVLHGRIDIGFDEFAARIAVTRPEGGEVWTAGSSHEIRWENSFYSDPVDIELSSDGGGSWQTLATGQTNMGTVSVALPGGVDSAQCQIQVIPSSAPAEIVLALASESFTIQPFAGSGAPLAATWPTLANNVTRSGLAAQSGPQLGCVRWTFDPNAPVYQSVTIGKDERIHVPTENGLLYTLDPNGQLLWSYNAGALLMSAPAVGLDGSLYVGAMNNRLYAFSPDGQLQWNHIGDGFVYTTPAVAPDGSVYFADVDGRVFALAPDGSELWSFDTGNPLSAAIGSILASPALAADGTLYIAPLYDPYVYALDPANGNVLWASALGGLIDPADPNEGRHNAQVFASPVVATDGTIYVGRTNDPNLYALDPADGSILWQTDLADAANPLFGPDYQETYSRPGFWSEPALGSDGTIYACLDDPYLRSLSPAGEILWITRLGALGGFTLTVGADDLIYAACDDNSLYVVSPAGEVLAHFDGNGTLVYPVIGSSGTLYLSETPDSSNTGRIWAIELAACQPADPLALHHPGDLNGDGISDLADLDLVVQQWLETSIEEQMYGDPIIHIPPYLLGDINRDLYIDLFDFQKLQDNWMLP